MALALAVFLCLGSGFVLVRLGWPRQPLRTADFFLQLSLSVGFGLGIFSLIFFLALVFHFTHLLLIDCIVFALLLLICFLLRRGRAVGPAVVPKHEVQLPAWVHRFVTSAFVIALAGALYAAILRIRAYPYGDGWDSFAIWNLHARFMFRGGEHWRDGFTAVLPWSRPDYPLLLPAAIAHFWMILSIDTPFIPALFALLFTFATAGVLFSALYTLRGRMAAMLGATALLATPGFIREGIAQYADIPLSLFVLATIVFLCLYDSEAGGSNPANSGCLILAGFSCAFGAWTKNEGLLFLAVILTTRFLILIPLKATHETWIATVCETAVILLAAAPILVAVAYFKHSIAPPDDVFTDSSTTLRRLLDPARYWIVLQWYVKEFLRFGEWLIPTTLTMTALYFVAGKRNRFPRMPAPYASSQAIVLTLAGCSVVYLITSYEIHWHLRFSLNRLFLQYWPSAIFLFFLSLRYDRHTETTPSTTPQIVSKWR
jgi:hypothetical protein